MTTDQDIDTDTSIPRSRRVHCHHCGEVIDRNGRDVYQRAEGWTRNRKQGGHNALALEFRHSAWSCAQCIDRLRHGIPIGQTKLF